MILHIVVGKPVLIKSNKVLDFASYVNGMELSGVLIYPFAIIRNDLDKEREKRIKKHESLHADQAMYITPIIWYTWYIIEYLYNRTVNNLSHKKAYKNISFELEAHAHQSDEDYEISLFSWLKTKK